MKRSEVFQLLEHVNEVRLSLERYATEAGAHANDLDDHNVISYLECMVQRCVFLVSDIERVIPRLKKESIEQ